MTDDPPRSTFPRENQRLQWVATTGIAVLSLTTQIRIFDRTVVAMDEGQLAAVAQRLLEGEVLYRDIHTGIGPGIYHFTAALFAAFGRDLIVTRWAEVGVNVTIAIALWILALRVVRIHWALLPPLAFMALTTVAFPVFTMLNYSSLALAGALLSLLMLLRYLESGRIRDGVLLGVMLSLTALTKQNYGALTIATVMIAVAWKRRETALADRSIMAAILPFVSSGAGVALLVLVYFGSNGALDEMIRDTLVRIGGPQIRAFNNPIPPILGAIPANDARFTFLYTPPTLFNQMLHGGALAGRPITPLLREWAIRLSYGIPLAALILSPFVLGIVPGDHQQERRHESRLIVLFAAIFFVGIFPSAIWSHLAFVMPPTFLVLALMLDRLEEWASRRQKNARRAALAISTAFLLAATLVCFRIGETIRTWFPTPGRLAGATLVLSTRDAALYRGAVGFIDRCAEKDAPIFVAPDIPIVYFLTQRRNPTPYELIIPGNIDEQLVIERLSNTKTRCVVFNPQMYPEFPPFEELFPALSRYLHEAYRPAVAIRAGGTEWQGFVRRPESTR